MGKAGLLNTEVG